MIYKPTISEAAKARRYLEKKSLSTIPITSQRESVFAAFARRLGNAIGFRREPVQSTHRHSHARDTPDVDERARLHSQPSRIRTYSFDAAANGHFTTTKQTPGDQSDHGMVASSASEAITGGKARQFSSFPNRAPRTGGGTVIDLEDMVTDFVRAEDTKRSGTGCAEELGREWKPTTII